MNADVLKKMNIRVLEMEVFKVRFIYKRSGHIRLDIEAEDRTKASDVLFEICRNIDVFVDKVCIPLLEVLQLRGPIRFWRVIFQLINSMIGREFGWPIHLNWNIKYEILNPDAVWKNETRLNLIQLLDIEEIEIASWRLPAESL